MRAATLDQRIAGVSYGWEGARGNSASVQRVNGSVLRRNRYQDPGLRAGVIAWDKPSSMFSSAARSAGSDSPSGYWFNAIVGPNELPLSDVSGIYVTSMAVSPGDVVTPSIYAKRSTPGRVGIRTWFIDSSWTVVPSSAFTDPSMVLADTNEVVRVVGVPRTAPEGASFFVMRIFNAPGTGSAKMPVGAILSASCASTVDGDWFDGDTQVNAVTINGVTPL